jgi:thioredoxin reductase (NADPH)
MTRDDACDCDVVVIGAGPAGLSTAVYAGAEEMTVRLLDAGDQPGGQAGQSTQIRNYFGFPDGVTGPQLAGLGLDGALSFGVELRAPVLAHSVKRIGPRFHVETTDESFTARSAVIATGATPRRHSAPGVAAYHGRGLHYRGPHSDHPEIYAGKTCYVIGGGNSAGQAATFLARHGCAVTIVVRGDGLAASMSKYLISEIESNENISLRTHTTVERVIGGNDRRVAAIELRDTFDYGADYSDATRRHEAADHVFMLLGAEPNTRWLRHSGADVLTDAQGFILTGADMPDTASWKAEQGRAPFPHETTMPGCFAAGDVRFGSLKRVAAAVGEGAGAYFDVHRYLNL